HEQADAEEALAACTNELAAARKREDAAQKELDAARQRERERTEAWYLARRVRDDLHQLDELLAARQHAEATLRSTNAALKDRRDDEKRARGQHSPVVGKL